MRSRRAFILAETKFSLEAAMISRRHFLQTTSALASAIFVSGRAVAAESRLKGRIRKSLKWNMVAEKKSLPLVDCFRKLKEIGFEGLEPRYVEVDDPEAWKAASKESGLIIDGLVAIPFDEIREGVDLCKSLGGDSLLLVVRYDQKKLYWDNWKETQAQIKAAAPHAEKQGIKLLLENVWASFLISPVDMQRYVDEIGSPAVGVHFDIGNVVRWGVSEHWIQVLGKRIKKLDVKEYDLKIAMNEGMRKGFRVPIGEGSINWANVREELIKMNYSGWAAAEVPGGDWDHLADIARRMDLVLGQT